MHMPKPDASHELMHALAGNWTGDERMHPSPWDPAGGTASARMTGRVALGGFAVIGDYEQRRGGQVTFTGHSVHTIDPATKEHVLHWFDCMGSGAEQFRGSWQGQRLVLTSQGPQGHMRVIYELAGKDTLISKMEMSQDGKKWSALVDATYRRQRD